MSLLNTHEPVFDYKTLYDTDQISMWLDLSTYCNAACPQCHRTDANGLAGTQGTAFPVYDQYCAKPGDQLYLFDVEGVEEEEN